MSPLLVILENGVGTRSWLLSPCVLRASMEISCWSISAWGVAPEIESGLTAFSSQWSFGYVDGCWLWGVCVCCHNIFMFFPMSSFSPVSLTEWTHSKQLGGCLYWWMERWKYGWMDGCVGGWRDVWVDEWMALWMERWMDVWMNDDWTSGWMDGCVGGRLSRWVVG